MTAKPCVIVTVNAPPPSVPNIVVKTFTLVGDNPRPWASGGQIQFQITWRNDGNGSGSFNPKMMVNDTLAVYGEVFGNASITLASGVEHTDNFKYVYGEYYGDFKFCPSPNP